MHPKIKVAYVYAWIFYNFEKEHRRSMNSKFNIFELYLDNVSLEILIGKFRFMNLPHVNLSLARQFIRLIT